MTRRIPRTLILAVLCLGCGFLAPLSTDLSSLIGPAPAEAAVSKSLSGGAGSAGGNVGGAGNRLGNLLSGWAVPVLTVLAGCLLVGALASRNIGASFGIVVITLIGLIFLLSPQSIESLAKGIANTVF
jgi:hypothetical protein